MTSEERNVREVRSTEFQYDMAPWGCEKSGHVVRFLADMVDRLRNSELSEAEKEELSFGLDGAIYDATKVLSFFSGGKWEPKDRDLIVEKGADGYEELRKKYRV